MDNLAVAFVSPILPAASSSTAPSGAEDSNGLFGSLVEAVMEAAPPAPPADVDPGLQTPEALQSEISSLAADYGNLLSLNVTASDPGAGIPIVTASLDAPEIPAITINQFSPDIADKPLPGDIPTQEVPIASPIRGPVDPKPEVDPPHQLTMDQQVQVSDVKSVVPDELPLTEPAPVEPEPRAPVDLGQQSFLTVMANFISGASEPAGTGADAPLPSPDLGEDASVITVDMAATDASLDGRVDGDDGFVEPDRADDAPADSDEVTDQPAVSDPVVALAGLQPSIAAAGVANPAIPVPVTAPPVLAPVEATSDQPEQTVSQLPSATQSRPPVQDDAILADLEDSPGKTPVADLVKALPQPISDKPANAGPAPQAPVNRGDIPPAPADAPDAFSGDPVPPAGSADQSTAKNQPASPSGQAAATNAQATQAQSVPAPRTERKTDPAVTNMRVTRKAAERSADPSTAVSVAADSDEPKVATAKTVDSLPSASTLGSDATTAKVADKPHVPAGHHHAGPGNADKTAQAADKPASPAATVTEPAEVAPAPLKSQDGVTVAAHRFAERLKGETRHDSDDLTATPLPTAPASTQPLTMAVATKEAAYAGAAVTLQQVASEIVRHADSGDTSFEIQLNPADLGRMDVRLDFSEKGEARAHIAVERRDTLEMLAKDQRQIEKTLRDAGYDARDGSVSLSLRQGGAGDRQSSPERNPELWREARDRQAENRQTEIERPVAAAVYRPRSSSVLDVRI